jgi:hypothetical protein
MPMRPLATRALIAVGASLVVMAPLTANLAQASSPGTHWTGGAPLPVAKGINLARNEDGEPGMGVTPDGQIWIASDIAPYGADPRKDPLGVLTGGDIWTSTDGGRSYHWKGDPFAEANNSFGLAGEDTDLAVAPTKNSDGFYNVYATSLWIGDSGLVWSTNGGRTWQLNRLGGTPTQDRPWLGADGPCTVYLGFHQLPTFTPVFDSYDVCTNGNVPVGTGAAIDPTHETDLTLSDFPGLSGSFNKFVVDTSPTSKYRHSIYQPMSLCNTQSEPDLLTNATASNCPKGTQYLVAVSRDKGATFTYHKVVLDPTGSTLVWAATVATDRAGNVYFTWSNSKNSYLDVSTDGGAHWTRPRKLNPAGTAAVYPTVAAGRTGRVDVAWYGTNRAGDSNDPKKMGKPNAKGSAPWTVQLARSTDGGSSFTLRQVTGTIHRGELCTHGSGCSDANSRNLLDDFGLTISPKTGLDSIAYTSDQPQGTDVKSFTGFTTEVADVTPTRAPQSSGGVAQDAGTGGSGSGGGSSLASTGASPLIALAGLGLAFGGLALRRRTHAP